MKVCIVSVLRYFVHLAFASHVTFIMYTRKLCISLCCVCLVLSDKTISHCTHVFNVVLYVVHTTSSKRYRRMKQRHVEVLLRYLDLLGLLSSESYVVKSAGLLFSTTLCFGIAIMNVFGPILWERLPYTEFACPLIKVFLIDFTFHKSFS